MLPSRSSQHLLRCWSTFVILPNDAYSWRGTFEDQARWYMGPEVPDALASIPVGQTGPAATAYRPCRCEGRRCLLDGQLPQPHTSQGPPGFTKVSSSGKSTVVQSSIEENLGLETVP